MLCFREIVFHMKNHLQRNYFVCYSGILWQQTISHTQNFAVKAELNEIPSEIRCKILNPLINFYTLSYNQKKGTENKKLIVNYRNMMIINSFINSSAVLDDEVNIFSLSNWVFS